MSLQKLGALEARFLTGISLYMLILCSISQSEGFRSDNVVFGVFLVWFGFFAEYGSPGDWERPD